MVRVLRTSQKTQLAVDALVPSHYRVPPCQTRELTPARSAYIALMRSVYGASDGDQDLERLLSFHSLNRVRPVSPGHSEAPTHRRPRGGATARETSPAR